jgi:CHAT domain-containing protein
VFPYLDALASGGSPVTGAHASEMFDAAQLIGSGVTATFVAQAAVRLGTSVPSVKALQNADQRVTELFQRRDIASNSKADQAVLQDIDGQIADAVRVRTAAEQEVRRTAPNYFQLVQGQPKASDLMAVLGTDEAFLQIVLGEKTSYGVLVRGGQITGYRIDLTAAQAAQTVKTLRQAFMPDARGQLPDYDVALAYDLYKRLLGPVSSRLSGARALIVSTDGALQSLPFALLVSTPPPPIAEAADYKKVAWLVKSTTLSYVPSAQSLVLLRGVAARSRAPQLYVGYGGFTPISTATAMQALQVARDGAPPVGAACAADARDLASLPRLALAESEVALAADKLGAGRNGVRTGAAFSRSSILRGGLDRYRIVHLATHALLPTELRCLQQPAILTGAGTGSESMLTAADIAGLRLDADLIVLSACNTAGPDGTSAGEALSGLARAFFTAGTRGVLVSHWNVADESTALMMVNMLTAVGKGTSPATAMRTVQVGMINGAGEDGDPIRWAHPFYWAPFVYAGAGVKE